MSRTLQLGQNLVRLMELTLQLPQTEASLAVRTLQLGQKDKVLVKLKGPAPQTDEVLVSLFAVSHCLKYANAKTCLCRMGTPARPAFRHRTGRAGVPILHSEPGPFPIARLTPQIPLRLIRSGFNLMLKTSP